MKVLSDKVKNDTSICRTEGRRFESKYRDENFLFIVGTHFSRFFLKKIASLMRTVKSSGLAQAMLQNFLAFEAG